MQLNVTRIVADAADDPDYGVNAWLATVPKDVGDAIPANVTVRDQTRDATVARKFAQAAEPNDDGPWLDIGIVEATEIDQLHTGGDTESDAIGVHFRWRVRSASTETAVTAGLLTMRAVRRFLRELCTGDREADRRRNGIELVSMLAFRHDAPAVSEDGEHVIVGATATMQAKDYDPDF
jgi:hypothetical protein